MSNLVIKPIGNRVVFKEVVPSRDSKVHIPTEFRDSVAEVRKLMVIAIGPKVEGVEVGQRITLTNQAASVMSAHVINKIPKEGDPAECFSIPEQYVAGTVEEE